MGVEGHNGVSQADWYQAFFDANTRAGSGGAMFWILTPDARRGYGVTYSKSRDAQVFSQNQSGCEELRIACGC